MADGKGARPEAESGAGEGASGWAAPAVSVVIPAYNYGRFVGDAIGSVLAQEYRALEVVVVDDGSNDNTREVVARFDDPRIRYVYQENAGLSAARNTGIRESRHDFVAFLDADDSWAPEKLQLQMAVFERYDDVGLVASEGAYVDADGQPLAGRKAADPRGDGRMTLRDLLVRTRFSPSSVVARKACFNCCGTFDTALRSTEDRDMWIRIAARFGVYRLAAPLTRVRCHGSNMSSHADRMKQNMAVVLGRAWRQGLVPRRAVGFWLRVFAFYRYQTAWMYFNDGRRGAAVRDLAQSMLALPWYPQPGRENEPPLFRLRALRRFLFDRPEP